jgi:hypothetical protein
VDWDGSAMGRTIGLKLSEKEEKIVTQLNKQGISNSELLRNSLRHYFEFLHESTSQDTQEKSILHTGEKVVFGPHESIGELKLEIHELRQLTKKTQEQLESDIGKLHRQLYELSIQSLVSKQIVSPLKIEVISDIHHEVDDFLQKRLERLELWK